MKQYTDKVSTTPLFILTLLFMFLVLFALEGEALTPTAALLLLVPITPVMVWSFLKSDLYEPVSKDSVQYCKPERIERISVPIKGEDTTYQRTGEYWDGKSA